MDLIDRYLAAVRRQLPPEQQDDIVQELGDSLRSEAEEQQARTGSPLDEAGQAELLKKRGHPWLMASRYQLHQYLIGPSLFPYYRQALTMVLFWVVLPLALFGSAISALYSDASIQGWLIRVSISAWNGAVYAVGIVTAVFYVLERQQVRMTALERWDPRTLPDARDGRFVPRSETAGGLVFGVLFMLWWIGVVRVPEVVFVGGAPVRLIPTAIWDTMFAPVLVMVILSLLISVIDLIRPWRTLAVSAIDLTVNAANVLLLAYVIQLRPQFFEIAADPAYADQVTRLARVVNAGMTWSVMVVAGVILLDMLVEIWRITQKRREMSVRFV